MNLSTPFRTLALAALLSIPLAAAGCRGPAEPEAPPSGASESAAPAAPGEPAAVELLPGSDFEVSAETAAAMQADGSALLIDVREQAEYDAEHIPGITLIPMSQLQDRVAEIPRDQPVILSCRSGNRSAAAVRYLRSQGYEQAYSQKGGINAWKDAGQTVE